MLGVFSAPDLCLRDTCDDKEVQVNCLSFFEDVVSCYNTHKLLLKTKNREEQKMGQIAGHIPLNYLTAGLKYVFLLNPLTGSLNTENFPQQC